MSKEATNQPALIVVTIEGITVPSTKLVGKDGGVVRFNLGTYSFG
jgi:hypothetical protein